ncbi:MAG: CBS domain-containing protein [Armatimonadetes bacterium]|nr:CBS domain-containing protein [Armatimonadota bacterium]
MLVREIMTPDPITVECVTPLAEAIGLMRERCVRRLPVMRDTTLIGIVTDRDLRDATPPEATRMSLWELGYSLARAPVERFMAPDVATVRSDDPFEKVAMLMYRRKIGGIPVVDDGRLVGIVTESDVFRTIIRSQGAWQKPEPIALADAVI